jgi:hypothetical protein
VAHRARSGAGLVQCGMRAHASGPTASASAGLGCTQRGGCGWRLQDVPARAPVRRAGCWFRACRVGGRASAGLGATRAGG